MRGSASRALFCLIAAGLLGCGGGQTTDSTTAENEAADPTPVEEAPPEETPPEETPDEEPDEEVVAEPEPEPPPPRPQPITPGSAEDIHQAILAASNEEAALHRLVDPVWGIGTYDPGASGSGISHHCDIEEVASHPGVAFHVAEGDRWRCDRDLRRCQASSSDGGGYVFHFRSAGSGSAVWLSAIIHHARAVPNRDSATIRNFVQSGDGVCDLWRVITDQEHPAPPRFSVFVGGHTGLVPETLEEHHCAAAARQSFIQRVQSVPRGQTLVCSRNPTRCGIQSGDQEFTFYGHDGGALAIAITRPGMFQNLEREQQRLVDGFLREFRAATCED